MSLREIMIYEIKNELNKYYDDVKASIDLNCQIIICNIENRIDLERGINNLPNIMTKYLNWIEVVETTQEAAMNAFKLYVSNDTNLDNMSKQALIKLHFKSILFIPDDEVSYRNPSENIGILIKCDWYLSIQQINFIKLLLLDFNAMKRNKNTMKITLDQDLLEVYHSAFGILFNYTNILGLYINRDHKDFFMLNKRKLDNLKILDLSEYKISDNISSIDYNCFVTIENVETLKITGNKQLNEVGINMQYLKGMKKLKSLQLTDINFVALQNGLFGTFSKLELLDLSNNNFEKLLSHDFKGLKNLKRLNLSGCSNINFIEEGFCLNFNQLEILNLAYSGFDGYMNKWIQKYKSKCFQGLISLKDLDLSGCKINNIEKVYFEYVEYLESLSLMANPIKFETKMFVGLKKLRYLALHAYNETCNNGENINHEDFEAEMLKNNIVVDFIH